MELAYRITLDAAVQANYAIMSEFETTISFNLFLKIDPFIEVWSCVGFAKSKSFPESMSL